MSKIQYYNRYTQQLETEQVYGESFLKWVYNNPLGKIALHSFVKRPVFSKWYGSRMDKVESQSKIKPFIQDYQLDSDEFAAPIDSFQSFNEFFYRKLKVESRPISQSDIIFPADGRHLGFHDISEIDGFFVKGQKFDIHKLLNNRELSQKYEHGSLVLSRLCPVDYHRFHFPVCGLAKPNTLINGPLFSVSPIALSRNLSYLWENKRSLTEIDTQHMGKVLSLEIGATCVGSIIQTYQPEQSVSKGEEKGYFAFGGSSTITIFEPGTIELSEDLIKNSQKQIETYALMGDKMGESKNA